MNREQHEAYLVKLTEHLHRLAEFRFWVDSNVLFPVVSDETVRPMREWVLRSEGAVLVELVRWRELKRAIVVYDALKMPMPEVMR